MPPWPSQIALGISYHDDTGSIPGGTYFKKSKLFFYIIGHKTSKYPEKRGQKSEEEKSRKPRQEKLSREEKHIS